MIQLTWVFLFSAYVSWTDTTAWSEMANENRCKKEINDTYCCCPAPRTGTAPFPIGWSSAWVEAAVVRRPCDERHRLALIHFN